MKRLFNRSMLLAWGLWSCFAVQSMGQVCDNMTMDFDGNADYISLTTTGTPVFGDANFTVEAWFTMTSSINVTCTGAFRRLITLAGTGNPASRFELGECKHQLILFWANPGGSIPVTTISTQLSDDCHHIAVVRNGTALNIYLDGALTPIYSGTLSGIFHTNLFRIGHWGGGSTSAQDWMGTVDDVRLWSVPRTAQQIHDYKDCTLSGTSPTGLEANWTFDQGPSVTPAGNNAGSVAQDMSGHNNDGAFSTVANGFALNGSGSNFVCNGCGPRYYLEIDNQVSLFPVSLTGICAGDPVHFCVTDNGSNISVPSGSMVMWESSDGGSPWVADADLSTYPNAVNALCFPVKKGVITSSNCTSTSQGFVDRKYRAKILKKMGPVGQQQICTYVTNEQNLRICCPPTGGAIQIVPNIPEPWCEGDLVSTTVFLHPSDPWLPFGPNVQIDWCMTDGVTVTPLPQYQNQLSFAGFQILVGVDDICLLAKISNCICPPITVKYCIKVDPMPVCGAIGITANPPTPIKQIGIDKYEICPGNYTILEEVNPSQFKNCNPVWQYHFDTDPPSSPNWQNLGSSNSSQNTNTLPQTDLNDPAFWPPGATCIYYRIECRPKSWPNSGCDPCHTNEIEICLAPTPPSGVITGLQQFCENGPYHPLTIVPNPNPVGPWDYCWYWNGLLQTSGPSNSYLPTMPGNYWVEIKNWCLATKVGPYPVEECDIVPIIKCPTDNPCACDGQPITLNGCDSYDTCNAGPLTYSWLALPSGHTGTGCTFMDTPDPTGTTYTLTVTNVLGCSRISKPFVIKPCN